MFIPDDARQRRQLDKLTPAAWLVYGAHCAARDHKRRVSYATKERIAREEGLAVKTVQNATTELRRKGWIREDGRGTHLLVGDFSPVDKRHQQPSLNKDSDEGENPYLGNDVPYSGNENPGLGKENPYLGNGAYIGSHARSDQPSDQPGNQPTHTHQPRDGDSPPETNGPAPGEGSVCVSGSKFSLDERRRYAANQRPLLGPGWLHTSADGRFDELIEAWFVELETEGGASARARDVSECPDCRGTGFFYPPGAKGVVKCKHPRLGEAIPPPATAGDLPPAEFAELLAAVESLVEAQGRDPVEVIAAQSVSAGDRARLLERFRGRAGPPGELVELRREGARV